MAMPDIVLGSDVPDLLVILQSGANNKFALTVQVDASELTDVDGELDFGGIKHVAVRTGSTYTWSLTDENVAALTKSPKTTLSLVNPQGRTLLGRGTTEVRL